MGIHPADITPCPGRVGVLEQLIRGYADKLGEHVVEPALGLTLGKINKDQAGNDVSKTIDIFAEIAAKDCEFLFRVQPDVGSRFFSRVGSRIKSLMWATSSSRDHIGRTPAQILWVKNLQQSRCSRSL